MAFGIEMTVERQVQGRLILAMGQTRSAQEQQCQGEAQVAGASELIQLQSARCLLGDGSLDE